MSERAEAQVQREVAASPERVWGLLSDVTRMGEWSPETVGCRWLRGATGPEVGARFKGSNRHGWRRRSTLCTVTDADPGGRFAFEVTAARIPVARWEYSIEPSERGCLVTERWVDRRSRAVAALIGPLAGVRDRPTHNRAQMAETLERLAAVAES